MIRTTALTKRYGAILAVDGVSLDVRAGDIYGFLGANGSGKTTTVRMILGLVLATGGDIQLLGQPMPRSARQVLPGRHAAKMERSHRELRARFADALRRDDADRFAFFDALVGREVVAVARRANAVSQLAR